MQKRQNGFTLIEILVVVSILGVLMGLVVVLVQRAPERQKEMETRTLVDSVLRTHVDKYNSEFSRYPACTVKELNDASPKWKGLTIDNSVNEAAECLYAALRHPDFTTPVGDDIKLANTDGDVWNQALPGANAPEAREIIDGWESPIVYINKSNYGKSFEIINGRGDHVSVEAMKKADGTYYNATSFQLISVGSDGKQNLDDPEGGDDFFNFKLERK